MQAKWIVLCQTLRESGYKDVGYVSLTPRALSSRFYARSAVVEETSHVIGDRTIGAYCALWKTTDEKLYQLGPLYLAAEWCTPHMAREILRRTLELIPRECRAFIIVEPRPDCLRSLVEEEAVRLVRRDMGLSKLWPLHARFH